MDRLSKGWRIRIVPVIQKTEDALVKAVTFIGIGFKLILITIFNQNETYLRKKHQFETYFEKYMASI